MVVAALLIQAGARSLAVNAMLDAMENSVKRFWSKAHNDWIVEPDWQLRSRLAVDVAHLIDGSPVKRSESVKMVGVMQGKAGPGSLDAIADAQLRNTVATLLTLHPDPAQRAGTQPKTEKSSAVPAVSPGKVGRPKAAEPEKATAPSGSGAS